MTVEKFGRIGRGTVTALTENFITVTSPDPLEADDFQVIYDEGYGLMFPPQESKPNLHKNDFEYVYSFKTIGIQ